MVPYTTMDPPSGSPNPRDLWNWLEELRAEDRRRCARDRPQRQPRQRHHVPAGRGAVRRPQPRRRPTSRRARWEPLYEVTQIKGDGETHPFLSPDDEFADYETWDLGNLDVSTAAKDDDMLAGEYAREALKRGLALERPARHEPVQVRHGRLDRQPHLPGHGAGGQLLRQALRRAEPDPERMGIRSWRPSAGTIMGWGQVASGLGGRLGDGEHARSALRRDGAQGGLRHDRQPHDAGALLRRLGTLPATRSEQSPARVRRLCEGRADGRRPARRRTGRRTDLHGLRPEGPDRRQPRPDPDRQGLAGRSGADDGEGLRRRLVRDRAARCRTASCRASATRSNVRDAKLDQHDWRGRTRHRLDATRTSIPIAACLLLRARHRDSDAALGRPTTPCDYGLEIPEGAPRCPPRSAPTRLLSGTRR